MRKTSNMLCVILAVVLAFSAVESRPAVSSIGLGTPRIMNGEDAVDGQYSWTLSVEYYGSLGWLHMCGAILITPYYAITGAKCVNNVNVVNLRAWAGLLYRNDSAATNAQQLSINLVTIHPGYNEYAAGIPNDIAMLRFAWAADTSRTNIAVARLPDGTGQNFNHGGCFINGWGKYDTQDKFANTMQWTQIPVITNQECADLLATISSADILNTHICVMSDPPGKGGCNGDGGSPVNCYFNENDPTQGMVVAGEMSWTVLVEGDCNPYYPTVYVRLSEYLDWITETTPAYP